MMVNYCDIKTEDADIYDVIVSGGGTAGWIAALSAARMGKRTLLLERKGYLGGVLSSGLPVFGFHDSAGNQIVKGLAHEFIERAQVYGGSDGHHLSDMWCNSICPLNGVIVKQVIIEMLAEAGVHIRLLSLVTDVVMDGNTIRGVIVQEKTDKTCFLGKVIIDATGDAIVSYYAGARILDNPGGNQPPTLLFRMENVNMEKLRDYLVKNPDSFVNWRMKPGCEKTENFLRTTQIMFLFPELMSKFKFTGRYPPVVDRIILLTVPNTKSLVVNMLRSHDIDCTSSESMTRAAVEQYRNMYLLFSFIRENVPGCEDSYLTDSEPEIQVRETRRVEGEYILTAGDVFEGRSFADSIAVGGYYIDIHGSNDSRCYCQFTGKKYGIPYRTMLPLGVEGLLTAGRCISGTKEASGSFRVMATCMAVGQAAGTAASLACDVHVMPREVDIYNLRQRLLMQDAVID